MQSSGTPNHGTELSAYLSVLNKFVYSLQKNQTQVYQRQNIGIIVAMSKKLLLLVKILTEIHYNYTHMLMQAQ
jgi:hypothetical protein